VNLQIQGEKLMIFGIVYVWQAVLNFNGNAYICSEGLPILDNTYIPLCKHLRISDPKSIKDWDDLGLGFLNKMLIFELLQMSRQMFH
jgi:hypothetical protein